MNYKNCAVLAWNSRQQDKKLLGFISPAEVRVWHLEANGSDSFLLKDYSLSQWLNFKLFGITYLVGKIKFKLFFSRSIGWVRLVWISTKRRVFRVVPSEVPKCGDCKGIHLHPRNIKLEPENHLFEKEHHLPKPSVLGFMLIFRGVIQVLEL